MALIPAQTLFSTPYCKLVALRKRSCAGRVRREKCRAEPHQRNGVSRSPDEEPKPKRQGLKTGRGFWSSKAPPISTLGSVV